MLQLKKNDSNEESGLLSEAVIVSAVRTAIARKGGALQNLSPQEYGANVVEEAVNRAGLEGNEIDDVIFGNCLAGGGNIARYVALKSNLSIDTPGMTIDRQCGSGINAVALAAQAIQAGSGSVYVAGGSESMTLTPQLIGAVNGRVQFVDRPLSPKEIGNPPMGITAENLAEKYEISRLEQDQYALMSQERMEKAVESGYFNEQILPLTLRQRKGDPIIFAKDEHPRPNTTIEALSKLPAVFKKDGTVTAGNSSGINDAAAALVVMSREEAEKRGLESLGTVKSFAVAGCDPNIMGIGPVPAVKKLLEKEKLTLEEIDLIELNEAFASQVLACSKELNLDMEKVNVNGGAIAHGHPIAATGAILVTKMVYEMKRRNAKRGIVTACIGGGQGIALLIER